VPQTQFLSAGVYGIEKAPARAAEGLSPAKMGIVGWTESGPTNSPIEVRSVEEFTSIFGPINSRGVVALAMRAYFNTGGQRAWVVRVVPSDALTAAVDIDAPIKWTFTANGAGAWGNDVTIRVRGNRNFLDRTLNPPAYTKFDLLALIPSDFNPAFLIADETYEAIQFTDPLASDYVVAAMTDPRDPSLLLLLTQGVGGTPAAFTPLVVSDENIGTGTGIQTQFTGTLLQQPVLDLSVRIVAGGTQIPDQAQTLTIGSINNINTIFEFTLPSVPVLDGSLRLFYAQATGITNFSPVVTGPALPSTGPFAIAAAQLFNIHKETTFFRMKYAGAAAFVGEIIAAAVPAAPFVLSTATPLLNLSAHPGTVTITGTIATVLTSQTDNGAGAFAVGALLPAGATINYDTGVITGTTASLDGATNVTATYNQSSIITKAPTADNLALSIALGGAATGTLGLVNSVATPTGSGAISFTTTLPRQVGTAVYIDYVRLRIVNSSVAGVLSGDTGVGTNLVNFITGLTDVVTSVAPRTGTTIDADYQTGLVVTDDGLGNLIGAIDALGQNVINYETGAYDVTFSTPPLLASAVLANYVKLTQFADYPLVGGTDGTAVARANISQPTLEATQGGIYAFDQVEDVLNVVVPDFEGSLLVQQDILDFCEARNSRFAIMGFANGTTFDEAIQYMLVTGAFDSKCGAFYWPNVYFVNEVTDRPELVPVTPFAAGVYAKTAFNRNVGKAPAGIEDGALSGNGTVGPEFSRQVMDIAVRDDLYQSRINPLFNSVATGFVVWGARSASKEMRWRYVQARTLHDFLMESLRRQLQWAVFENNGPNLWLKIETTLKGYMSSLYRAGYFAGVTEAQAYFVKCNRGNNNQSTIDAGKVIIDVGFSPFKPAEFVIFTLQQPASFITV